ncbi:leukocyte cysteine proteinase inhibitor 1-like [Erythrolamprus reginae]|uniref:leukocyte cysteine proteinase inhibitor 1-like n=1 Tax=Erythrolamprus reginae TaxID=121349 RepID=UPI00396C889F
MSSGGLSDPEPATSEIQGLADQVKGQLEEATGKNYAIYRAILYRAQVVVGTNYFLKVQFGGKDKDYIHLRIFQALPAQGGRIDLSGFQQDKTLSDPIIYF